MLDGCLNYQLFNCFLLLDQTLIEGRNLTYTHRFSSAVCNIGRNFNHGIVRQILNRPPVFYHYKVALAQVEGQAHCYVYDKFAVYAAKEFGQIDFFSCAAFHYLVGAGVVGIAAFNHFIAQKIILHIGIWQIIMECRADMSGIGICMKPGGITVHYIALFIFGHISVFCHIGL